MLSFYFLIALDTGPRGPLRRQLSDAWNESSLVEASLIDDSRACVVVTEGGCCAVVTDEGCCVVVTDGGCCLVVTDKGRCMMVTDGGFCVAAGVGDASGGVCRRSGSGGCVGGGCCGCGCFGQGERVMRGVS